MLLLRNMPEMREIWEYIDEVYGKGTVDYVYESVKAYCRKRTTEDFDRKLLQEIEKLD